LGGLAWRERRSFLKVKRGTFRKRRYIRINSVLPVEFYLTDRFGKRLTPYLQGFTNNIGKGGICLVVNDLWWGFSDRLKEGERITLEIEFPFRKKKKLTYGYIVWKEIEQKRGFLQYKMGIEFESKSSPCRDTLFLYALTKKIVPYFVSIIIVTLSAIAFNVWLEEIKLKKENQKILYSYHTLLEERDNLRSNIAKQKEFMISLNKRKEELSSYIEQLKEELATWQKKYELAIEKKEDTTKTSNLKQSIEKLKEEIVSLEAENSILKRRIRENKNLTILLNGTLNNRNEQFAEINNKVIEGMYEWIKNRQDLHTGLVLSYEGDKSLNKVAFTYDEALAVIVFVIHNDVLRARKILDFYMERINAHQPLYNAYYTNCGVFEYIVHSGVNAWIGLATLYYTKNTGDSRYMKLAHYVAKFLLKMMDKEGGIRGGPKEKWYSTEHNLDSFAFLYLFYQLTGKEKYLEASKKIEKWLDKYAYTDFPLPVNRGKGDATIATDTYAWSITALGPKKLSDLGRDIDEIIDFAIKNCGVKTTFKYNGKEVNVEGFDFARARNIGRGGVISCEWTAQMILALENMADYYKNIDPVKFNYYINKALFYAQELGKMIIISPSPVGRANPTLPYASQPYVDTGHGWRTPKGNRVGSLSATAYFIIAYYGINPLKAVNLEVSLKNIYEKRGNLSYTKIN